MFAFFCETALKSEKMEQNVCLIVPFGVFMQAWNANGRIAELLGVLAVDEGYSSSLLDGVRFMRAIRKPVRTRFNKLASVRLWSSPMRL